MNIFIATYGTRGDVEPYIALGKGRAYCYYHHQRALSKSDRNEWFTVWLYE